MESIASYLIRLRGRHAVTKKNTKKWIDFNFLFWVEMYFNLLPVQKGFWLLKSDSDIDFNFVVFLSRQKYIFDRWNSFAQTNTELPYKLSASLKVYLRLHFILKPWLTGECGSLFLMMLMMLYFLIFFYWNKLYLRHNTLPRFSSGKSFSLVTKIFVS